MSLIILPLVNSHQSTLCCNAGEWMWRENEVRIRYDTSNIIGIGFVGVWNANDTSMIRLGRGYLLFGLHNITLLPVVPFGIVEFGITTKSNTSHQTCWAHHNLIQCLQENSSITSINLTMVTGKCNSHLGNFFQSKD